MTDPERQEGRDIYDDITPDDSHPVPAPSDDWLKIEPSDRPLECEHREPDGNGGLILCENPALWATVVPFGSGASRTRYCDEHIDGRIESWMRRMREDRRLVEDGDGP